MPGRPGHVDGQDGDVGRAGQQRVPSGQQPRGRAAVRRVLAHEGHRARGRHRVADHDHLDRLGDGGERVLEQGAAGVLDRGLVDAVHPGGGTAGEDHRGEVDGHPGSLAPRPRRLPRRAWQAGSVMQRGGGAAGLRPRAGRQPGPPGRAGPGRTPTWWSSRRPSPATSARRAPTSARTPSRSTARSRREVERVAASPRDDRGRRDVRDQRRPGPTLQHPRRPRRGSGVDYRKIHLYDSFGYRESDRLTAGRSAGALAEVGGFTRRPDDLLRPPVPRAGARRWSPRAPRCSSSRPPGWPGRARSTTGAPCSGPGRSRTRCTSSVRRSRRPATAVTRWSSTRCGDVVAEAGEGDERSSRPRLDRGARGGPADQPVAGQSANVTFLPVPHPPRDAEPCGRPRGPALGRVAGLRETRAAPALVAGLVALAWGRRAVARGDASDRGPATSWAEAARWRSRPPTRGRSPPAPVVVRWSSAGSPWHRRRRDLAGPRLPHDRRGGDDRRRQRGAGGDGDGARGQPRCGVLREVMVATAIAAVGALAMVGLRAGRLAAPLRVRDARCSRSWSPCGLVYRLGAGLHGLGRRGVLTVARGGTRPRGHPGVRRAAAPVRHARAGRVAASTRSAGRAPTSGRSPRPLEAVLGIPALDLGGPHAGPPAAGLVGVLRSGSPRRHRSRPAWSTPRYPSLESSLAVLYGVVVGLAIGFLLIRVDLLLSGTGRRQASAAQAEAVRSAPRTRPLL